MSDERDPDVWTGASRFRPRTAARRSATFERLDPTFERTWRRHVGRLLVRPELDVRRRCLVFTAQYTMLGNLEALEELLEAAIGFEVDPVELLEAVLQCYTYAGESRVEGAATVFTEVAERLAVLDDVSTRTRSRAPAPAESIEALRESWSDAERDDARVDALVERYGERGLATGMRLRPGHVITLATTLNALDPDFLQVWLDTVHEDMYSRGVLDHATRLLCVIGACFAIGETHQSRRHMRNALREGVAPRELLEVVFQSMAVVGHPGLMPMAIDDLIQLVDEFDRLDELVDRDRLDEVRHITAERVARRGGTQDMTTGTAAR